jgi:hypothetical protein
VHGYPTYRGMVVDWVQDVGRIENVHFSPMGFEFEPDGPYMRWVFAHGVAFEFAQTDWQYVLNTFCFGYKVGYKFIQSKMGRANGNFLGIAADCCRRPILVEECSDAGLLITNGEFVGQWGYGKSIGVEVLPGCTGVIQLSNCSFFGPFDRLIKVSSPHAKLSASSCNFRSWDNDGDDSEAIQVDAGRVIVQGSFFRAAKLHVAANRGAEAVTLVGNQAVGGLNVRNKIGPRLRLSANEENLMTWPEGGKLHYRLDIGSVGDTPYLHHWGSFGKADEWKTEPKGTRRWSKPGSELHLPVAPGKPYTITLDVLVPEEAVHAQHGLYLGEKQLTPLNRAGFQQLTGRIPAQPCDVVKLSLKAEALPPMKKTPLFRLLIPARTLTMIAEGSSQRVCSANTGEWMNP